MNRIMHELYTFEDKTSDEVLLINGFQHINQLIPYINDLQKQNIELKEKILLLKASEPMLEFVKQTYKDNWNKLKECLNEAKHEYRLRNNKDLQDYYEVCVQQINNILDKMQEIEGGMND